jgi:hypothetical protein
MKKLIRRGLFLWLAVLVGCASLPFGYTQIGEITAAPASSLSTMAQEKFW